MSRRSIHAAGSSAAARFRAVDNVSFSLSAERPEIFTIVGELGSGKTTLSRMILSLVAPSEGVIRFRGEEASHRGRRKARLRFMAAVQPIFQNPFEAFNPLKRVDRYLIIDGPDRFAGARSAPRKQSAPPTRR